MNAKMTVSSSVASDARCPLCRDFVFQLFDFDVEVLPVLEVLIGKTLEQALLEVMEEEELANLREQQRTYEEMRNAENMEQERLEEQERRHKEEKVGRTQRPLCTD